MAFARRALSTAVLLPLLAACPPEEPPKPPLENRTFLSQSVTEQGNPRALVSGTQLRLTFRDDPRVGASAGCNSMDATFRIVDGTFVVESMGITEIGCDQARHDQDDWYFGFLASAPAIEVDGDTLVLDGEGIRIEYLDQEIATPDLPLQGTTWTVDTIVRGQAATNVPATTPATFVFGDDGTVSVATGCNSGSGVYDATPADGTIFFQEVAVTERACDDPAAQELETAVLDLVHGPQPIFFEITVDRLSMDSDAVGLGLVGTP